MRWILRMAAAALVAALAAPSSAEDRPAGDFDYYLLSLSWSPSWCETDGRGADQCAQGRGFGFTLHGLWPQYETGYPDFCRSGRRDPSRGESNAMADIMGSGGLAWHQWKKHGRCSGLSAEDYYALSRTAYDRVARPEAFRKLREAVRIDAEVVEAAFMEANPGLTADGITVVCRDGRIREVRICLTRDLAPRDCGADARRDCTGSARMSPIP